MWKKQTSIMTLKGLNSYKTDEGGDVSPAVLHHWEWTITNHVCDVTIETLSTFKKALGISKLILSSCWDTKCVQKHFCPDVTHISQILRKSFV